MPPTIRHSAQFAKVQYLLQVPANRLGYGMLNLAQLKIAQEVITLVIFVPFAVFYMHQPMKSDSDSRKSLKLL